MSKQTIIGVPDKVDKKIIQEAIQELKDKIENTKHNLPKLSLMERFIRRKSVIGGTKMDMALGAIQGQIKNQEKQIKTDEEYLEFLREVENE